MDGIDYNRAIVVVPIYQSTLSRAEIVSFRRTLNVLAKWDITVVAPRKLQEFLEGLKGTMGFDFGTVLFPDRCFLSIAAYNKLLTSKYFYKSFSNYEYMLIVQTDALVLSDALNEWCARQYSYIGSPWFIGLTKPEKPLTFCGVGNGGFSLRNIEDFIRVLSFPRRMCIDGAVFDSSTSRLHAISGHLYKLREIFYKYFFSYNFRPFFPNVNEDVFWGCLAPKTFDFFSVPDEEVAAEFSFETEPEFLFGLIGKKLPFGCHAWERYDVTFWRDIFSKNDIYIE